MNRKSLPALIFDWIAERKKEIENALFRALLRKHGIHTDPSLHENYTYWMNIVKCVGGMEKQKPCEYIFENPWHARMHEEICRSCMTWEFVATVKISSPVQLTTTDYQKLVEKDEEYMRIIAEMQMSSIVSDKEL